MYIGIALDNQKYIFEDMKSAPQDMFFPSKEDRDYYDEEGDLKEDFWGLPKYEQPRKKSTASNRGRPRKS